MDVRGSVALITGANRGIGREFVTQLLDRGATVWAAGRQPFERDGVRTLQLDITDPASVAAAAELAQDVTLLVNNAGIATGADLVGGSLADVEREMATHFFGTLAMTRAFAPVLARNGGGAILNVLSVLSWRAFPGAGGYHAAKAAEWALTNATRLELAAQGTLVTGLHLGAADTDMMARYDGPKVAPTDVVRQALDGLEAGAVEVLADAFAVGAKAALALDPREIYG